MTENPPFIGRIARFSLTTADVINAAQFYEAAFGCKRIAMDRLAGPDFEQLMGVTGGANRITLGLGREIIELVQFDLPGEPYPRGSSASDLIFQHFAIVVADMKRAFQRLSTIAGWTPISTAGPQRLPASSGGVTAFKFRDPEGHPLEFLSFPNDARSNWSAVSPGETCLGIDHSAISVSDNAASVAFYKNLGLSVSECSFNQGAEQQKLDDITNVQVEITALESCCPIPHLELLCYRRTQKPLISVGRSNDIASTHLVFESRSASNTASDNTNMLSMRDPDGHAFLVTCKI